MATKVVTMKVRPQEHARWVEVSHLSFPSFNAWARDALNREADRVLAEQQRVRDQVAERERVLAVARPFTPDFKKGN